LFCNQTAVGSDITVWLDAFGEGNLPQQGWRNWLFGLSPVRETMAALRQVGLLGGGDRRQIPSGSQADLLQRFPDQRQMGVDVMPGR